MQRPPHLLHLTLFASLIQSKHHMMRPVCSEKVLSYYKDKHIFFPSVSNVSTEAPYTAHATVTQGQLGQTRLKEVAKFMCVSISMHVNEL